MGANVPQLAAAARPSEGGSLPSVRVTPTMTTPGGIMDNPAARKRGQTALNAATFSSKFLAMALCVLSACFANVASM